MRNPSHWLTKDRATGKPIPTSRFEGGAFDALRRVPKTMSEPTSYQRKLLSLLAHVRSTTGLALTPKEITAMFFDMYGEAHSKNSINARLSEFYTWGLVVHEAINRSGGKWAIAPKVDARNTKKLLATIESNRLAQLGRDKPTPQTPSRRLPELR